MRSHSAGTDRRPAAFPNKKHDSEYSKVKLDVTESNLPLVHPNPPKYKYCSAASYREKGFQMELGCVGTDRQPHRVKQGSKCTDMTLLSLLWTAAGQGCGPEY